MSHNETTINHKECFQNVLIQAQQPKGMQLTLQRRKTGKLIFPLIMCTKASRVLSPFIWFPSHSLIQQTIKNPTEPDYSNVFGTGML